MKVMWQSHTKERKSKAIAMRDFELGQDQEFRRCSRVAAIEKSGAIITTVGKGRQKSMNEDVVGVVVLEVGEGGSHRRARMMREGIRGRSDIIELSS